MNYSTTPHPSVAAVPLDAGSVERLLKEAKLATSHNRDGYALPAYLTGLVDDLATTLRAQQAELEQAMVRVGKLCDVVRRFDLDCNVMHHGIGEYHKSGEQCPVVAKALAALAGKEQGK